MAIRPITDTLRQLRGGEFLDEASDALAELVEAVDATGKRGKIILEINIKKATRGGAMVLIDKVMIKKPVEAPAETMLFATPEGNLVTSDPRQGTLELKTVDEPATAVKTVND